MATVLTPDICVIGAGSGGLSVAAAAAAFGAAVVLIEKGRMGADGLDGGSLRSQALIAAARHAHAMRTGGKFGIADTEPDIDFRKVQKHVRSVVAATAPNGSAERLTALGVRVIEAEARFKDQRTVAAGDFDIRARRFVVATGSTPLVPPIPGLDTVDHLTDETLFELTRRPGHLIVVGGGSTGLEIAQAYRRLGSEVTVIEAAAALGEDDPELVALVLRALRAEGVTICEGTRVVGVERRGKTGLRVEIDSQKGRDTVDATHMFLAAGRSANIGALDLEKAGVSFDDKGISVTPKLRTSNRRVYAIGDVTGAARFAHLAGYHAGLVVRALLFRQSAQENLRIVPRVTFTDPELASVGMTEDQARKSAGAIRILRWPYCENDRALAERRTEGHIKLVTDRKGNLLGVSIVGVNADEMINMWSLALSKGLGLRDISDYVPPYPTMTEIGKRAAMTYFVGAARKPLTRALAGLLRRLG